MKNRCCEARSLGSVLDYCVPYSYVFAKIKNQNTNFLIALSTLNPSFVSTTPAITLW